MHAAQRLQARGIPLQLPQALPRPACIAGHRKRSCAVWSFSNASVQPSAASSVQAAAQSAADPHVEAIFRIQRLTSGVG